MAQQVKFYKVTQSEYTNISNKNVAGLYFTSDNGGLYLGSTPIEPTVFSATDGKTYPETTTISSLTLSPSVLPKQGDILVVTQENTYKRAYAYYDGAWVAITGDLTAATLDFSSTSAFVSGATTTKAAIETLASELAAHEAAAGASFTEINSKIATMDLATVSFGVGKILSSISETDGQVTVEQRALISDDITDAVSSLSEVTAATTENDITTLTNAGKVVEVQALVDYVTNRIDDLDSDISDSVTTGKVISSIEINEVDGKLSSITLTETNLSASDVTFAPGTKFASDVTNVQKAIESLRDTVAEGVISEVSAAADTAITVTQSGDTNTERVVGLKIDSAEVHSGVTLSQSSAGLKVDVSGISSAGGITSVETKFVEAKAVDALVKTLDATVSATSIATQGKIIDSITIVEENGKLSSVSTTTRDFVSDDVTDAITSAEGILSTETKLAQSKAIKAYVDNSIAALDVSNITGFGSDKTLATLIETDGKISATFQDIKINSDDVVDSISAGSSITSTETKLVQAKAVQEYVASEIAGLDSEKSSAPITAGHVVTGVTVNEVDGKIDSVTVTNAQLDASEITYTHTFPGGSAAYDNVAVVLDEMYARIDTAEDDIDEVESRMTFAEQDIDVLESNLVTEITSREQGDEATLTSANDYTDDEIQKLDATVSLATGVATTKVIDNITISEADGKLTEVTVSTRDLVSNDITDALDVTDSTVINKVEHPTSTGLLVENQTLSAYVTAKVADIAGAMHYVGQSTTDFGGPTNPTIASHEGNWKAGDVAIKGTKEYIYNGTIWEELGDEGSHVQKTQKIAGIALEGDIASSTLRNALISEGNGIDISDAGVISAVGNAASGITVTPDGIGVVTGSGITVDSNKVIANIGTGLAFDTDGKIKVNLSAVTSSSSLTAADIAAYKHITGVSVAIDSAGAPAVSLSTDVLDAANIKYSSGDDTRFLASSTTTTIADALNALDAALAADEDYLASEVTKNDSDAGVSISVTTSGGRVFTVDVEVTPVLMSEVTSANTGVADARDVKEYVDNGLAWYAADGTTLATF